MNTSKQPPERTLSGKFMRSLVILSLVICVCVSALVAALYYQNRMREFDEYAFSLGRMAADYIDGDRIPEYVATGRTDEYYDQVQRFMDMVKRDSNVWYYYVFVHDGDGLIYVWDAWSNQGMNHLGDRELYMKDARAAVEAVLSENPPEDFIVALHPEYGLTGTARVPIYDSAGKPVAVVGVDLYMPVILRMILFFVLAVVAAVVVVTAFGGMMYYGKIRRDVLRPISLLDQATGEIVENIDSDVPFEVDIHTGDELEELADSFGKMDQGLRKYIRQLAQMMAEKEYMVAELSVAKQIQEDMLPRRFPPFPERGDFDIFATMTPARDVGGDFYDFFLVDDDHLALVMADVAGKGIPAALFMAIAKALIKNRVMAGDSPAEALGNVNEQLCEGNDAMLFVTVWLAVIELSTGRGVAANAGHEHPALRRAGGQYELVVYKHSLAVATLEGIHFREHGFQLLPGDSLFVYTDGVTEATDSHNALYGEARMLDALNANASATPAELLPAVKRSIDAFVGEAPQFDDITMLGLLYRGNGNGDTE